MSSVHTYEPSYSGSHALVVGINKYPGAPLARATNDANAIARILVEKFKFPTPNVALLTDEKATRAAIMRAYMCLANPDLVSLDDRVLVFFAGHGHTVAGRRETGYLVPVDGDTSDLSTLIRWDELTRGADVIPAKHMLFLMDACYGGLAVTRKIPPGSSRYLEDMLSRVTRQVVTAGKANETVSDGGGTRAEHSIFTSSLLDALDGAAASSPGVITAMGVMAYVHERVGKDPNSNQTPHFGFIDGDGDFIFEMPERDGGEKKREDILVRVPQYSAPDTAKVLTIGEHVQELIPDPSARIRLDNFVTSQLRQTLHELAPAKFPTQGQQQNEVWPAFIEYVGRYEKVVTDLQRVLVQLCRWAESPQLQLTERVFQTLAEHPETRGGYNVLANLDWYPVMCAMYAGGISAISASRFDVLKSCLLTEVKDTNRSGRTRPVIVPTVYAMTELVDGFKKLPEMAQRYSPRSDHMLTVLQPIIEDELFLGKRYEDAFDKFEIMLALVFADVKGGVNSRIWGPPGRFAWKAHSFNSDTSPFNTFVEAAKKQGQSWPALKEGFFNGSAARFIEVADGYKELIGKLNWH